MRRLIWRGLDLAAVAVVAFAVGLVLGWFYGEYGAKQNRFDEEQKLLATVLAEDPAWSGLSLDFYTADGMALLQGSVPTQADFDRLRARVQGLFGVAGDMDRLHGVDILRPGPPPESAGREP